MISDIRRLEVIRAAEEVIAEAVALPIDPFAIAKSRDMLVKPMETPKPGISGFLMKHEDNFGIGYSTRIQNQGYINFTVAHELGHYFIPGHPEKLFANGVQIHASQSGFITSDPIEQEADYFAATLLMPEKLFRAALRKTGQGFTAIEHMARTCVTSLTATAIRFTEFSDNAVAVIVSSDGVVEFCCLSQALRELDGVYPLRRHDALPGTSATARFQRNPLNVADASRVEGSSLLSEWLDGAPQVEMKEDVIGLGHYGKTLTVLFTEEPVEADPDDEDAFDRFARRGERED